MIFKHLAMNLHSIPPLEIKFSAQKTRGSSIAAHSRKKLPKNHRTPRRSKLPPDFGVNLFLKKPAKGTQLDSILDYGEEDEIEEENGEIVWESDEIEAISSLFQGRIPQKPGELGRERPLPLPLPYKLRPLGVPSPKHSVKAVSPWISSSRASISNQVYKNPRFLIGLAKQIRSLNPDQDVCLVLDDCARFLRKQSLSMTIHELGHMNLPERALQTFCWAQKQPHLFPDDHILASTVEVLARNQELKMPLDLHKFASLASRGVIEAMIRGFIRGGSISLARKILLVSQQNNRMLDPSIYTKLIVEFGENPDKHTLVVELLDQLAEKEELNLNHQDCTSVMKVCTRLRKFEFVESLFSWFKQSGREPNVVMYTTLIHSRYCEEKYREALAVVWEMEGSNCLFDLTAYRVVIKLFVALNDLSRAVRYFAKLKEAGFSPTYDIYKDLISIYMVSGRLAKCKEIVKEAEMAGFKLDRQMESQLLQLETATKSALSHL